VLRCEIQSVKQLNVARIDCGGLSLGYHIKSGRTKSITGSAGNSDEGDDILAGDAHEFGCRNGLLSRRNETRLPEAEGKGWVGVGIKGKDAILLSRHKLLRSEFGAGDGEIGHIKRLCVSIAVKQTRKEPAKRRRSDGRGRQCEFLLILARARGVVRAR